MAEITPNTKVSVAVLIAIVVALAGSIFALGKASAAQVYAENRGEKNATSIEDLQRRVATNEANAVGVQRSLDKIELVVERIEARIR